jgi:outer membrane protein assembly factor BamB
MYRYPLLLLCVTTPLCSALDWPRWFGPKDDGAWHEDGILTKFPDAGLKPVWKTKIGAGYSGPSMADGLVYVMDRVFGDDNVKPTAKLGNSEGKERVLCLNAKTGAIVWKHEYACKYVKISYGFGPRTTPNVVGDKVYTLGTMGDLFCLDAKKGTVIWQKNFITDFKAPTPIWGWSANVLIDGDNLYSLVGGEKRAVVCFDRHKGTEKWGALTAEEIGYAPPVIVETGGKRQLIIWHSTSINSLNPENGEKYWTEKYPKDVAANRPAAPISTPRFADNKLFITSYYHGPIALNLDPKEPKASVAWRPKSDEYMKVDGLRSLMSTPIIKDGHVYGICRDGELRCQKLDTGEELWNTMEHQGGKKTTFGTSFMIPHKDRCFLFCDNGDLVIAELSPKGYKEVSRTKVIQPTQPNSGRDVVWSHPAFANKCIFVRNDQEIVCVNLAG